MVYTENPEESIVRINKSIWQICWIEVNVVSPHGSSRKNLENKKLKIPFTIIYIHKDPVTRNISKEKVCKSSSLKTIKTLKTIY